MPQPSGVLWGGSIELAGIKPEMGSFRCPAPTQILIPLVTSGRLGLERLLRRAAGSIKANVVELLVCQEGEICHVLARQGEMMIRNLPGTPDSQGTYGPRREKPLGAFG
jgi:hypothetical protein